jgi:hypothetical protein
MVSNDKLESLGLHTCRLCNSSKHLFAAKRYLKSHMTRCHPTRRTKTNPELITASYPQTQTTTWIPTLHWLHHLDVKPPTHHGNIWRSLSSSTRQDYHATLQHVLQWILAASDSHPDACLLPSHHILSTAFWKLLLLMDPLLLHPPQPSEPPNFNEAVSA